MSCAVCGTQVPLDAPMQWVCPGATPSDRHHVLGFNTEPAEIHAMSSGNPFLSFRQQLGVDAFGAAIGLDETTRIKIIASLDESI